MNPSGSGLKGGGGNRENTKSESNNGKGEMRKGIISRAWPDGERQP